MARAVVLAYPTQGHLAPILPVAGELARRGEDGVFYGTGRSRRKIEGTGARFLNYARGHDDFNPTPPTSGLFSDMARLAALTADMLPRLLDEVRALAPAYLLIDTKSLWGRLVGQILGIPAVTLSVVFAIRDGVIGVPELTGILYSGAPAEKLLSGLLGLGGYFETARRLGRRYGTVAPGIVAYLGNPQPLNIVFTSRELQPGSQAFGDEFVFVGPSIPPARDASVDFPFDWLDSRQLVYVSLGTTFHNVPAFYRACFEALGGGPWQVVLSTGGGTFDFVAPPENFLVRQFVPQLALLNRAAAFVTHGGMNSANEALYFGVPLVVVPQRGDQHMVGARVAELGAGLAISPGDIDAARLQGAEDRALQPGVPRQGAGAWHVAACVGRISARRGRDTSLRPLARLNRANACFRCARARRKSHDCRFPQQLHPLVCCVQHPLESCFEGNPGPPAQHVLHVAWVAVSRLNTHGLSNGWQHRCTTAGQLHKQSSYFQKGRQRAGADVDSGTIADPINRQNHGGDAILDVDELPAVFSGAPNRNRIVAPCHAVGDRRDRVTQVLILTIPGERPHASNVDSVLSGCQMT